MCKKQTSVPHSLPESEAIPLDAGLRMGGIPALDLWDLVIEVLHSNKNIQQASRRRCREEVSSHVSRNRVHNETLSTNTNAKTQ